MKLDESVDLLKNMVDIYSPSGKEKKIASYIMEKMVDLGFRNVRSDRVGNVLGEWGTGSPTIMLCGHMDTIPGYLPVKVEENKIFGRGAVDAKSSLAAMISTPPGLKIEENSGKVIVVCCVDEERKSKGIRQILKEKLSVDYAIFGEPSGLKGITIGYKGYLVLKVKCKTEAGHVGARGAFKNAIEEAYGLWNKMKSLLPEKGPSNGGFHSVTASLTGIKGGEAVNVTPSTCTLTINVRLPPEINCEKGVELFDSTISQFKLENPDVNFEMKVEDMIEPFIVERDTPLIRALRWAIVNTAGGPVELLKKTGTGDMNIFWTYVKIPVATYGPGNSHLSHTWNEFVEINEYLASIEVYRKTITKILSLHA